jgi:crossover junction endodeoxyribonuclease RuvC
VKILAIDPGLTGGACIYAPSFSVASGLRWQVIDLPTVGETSQRRINAPVLRDFIVKFSPDHSFIESVATMPKQGISSAFRFGRACGAIDAVVAVCGVPIHYITPQRWKKYHGLKGSDKEQSRAKALQLAPELSSVLERKKDHGRAEAALLAMFGEFCLRPISETSKASSSLSSHNGNFPK